MTAVFSATWQSFSRGVHASPIGVAGLAALRESLSSSSRSKHRLRSIHRSLVCLPPFPPRTCNAGPTTALYEPLPRFAGQARGASRWKNSRLEEPPRRRSSQSEAPMTRAEIKAIFGLYLDRKDGNDLLKRLQEHRHRGTLDQELPYPKALVNKGLTYLRANHPFDEDAAIIERIDKEEDERDFRLPQTNMHLSPHAVSQFDKLRRENIERRKKEEMQRQQEAENKRLLAAESPIAEEIVTAKDGMTSVQSPRRRPEWLQAYRDRATMKEIPEISSWARLVPSGLVTVAVVTLAVFFAQNYEQPLRNARLWPDLPAAAATVIAIVGVNVAVFVLWRMPPLWRVFNRTFIVVPAYPSSVSMLAACFSHQSLAHLLSNIIPLWFIGTSLHDDIGRGPFLAVYFSCAVIAAYVPTVIYVMRNYLGTSTLGASGVLTGLIGTSCVLHEGQIVTVPFLPSEWTRGVDTGVILAMSVLWEVMSIRKWGIVSTKMLNTGRPHVDNMGHLSGYLAGIGAGAFIRSTDPKWRNAKRSHFFTKDFSKG